MGNEKLNAIVVLLYKMLNTTHPLMPDFIGVRRRGPAPFEAPSDAASRFYEKYKHNKRYQAYILILQALMARSMHSQGQTKINNKWLFGVLARNGLSLQRRQLTNILRRFESMKIIQVVVTRHKSTDESGQVRFKTSRQITVWPVLATRRYMTVDRKMWSDDNRLPRRKILRSVPLKYKVKEESVKINKYQQYYAIEPAFKDMADAVYYKKWIPAEVVSLYNELKYDYDHYQDEVRNYARMVLGYSLGVRLAMIERGRKMK